MQKLNPPVTTLLALLCAGLLTAMCPGDEPAPSASRASHDTQTVRWIKTYGAARRKGVDDERPVFLFVTSDDCRYCRKMEEESLNKGTIIQHLRKSFIPARLKLDAESKLARDLKVTIFPTTVIIAPDGKIVDYVRGYMDEEKLTECISEALKATQIASSEAKTSR